MPPKIPSSVGIPDNVFDNVLVAPFNNLEATEKIIHANRDDLAAVITEPVMTAAGVIPASDKFLGFLREITRELGIVLIFDEVVTMRLAPGGGQEIPGDTLRYPHEHSQSSNEDRLEMGLDPVPVEGYAEVPTN